MPEIIVKLGNNIVQKNFFVKEPMRIGRAPDNEIVIENLSVSRNHAIIVYEEEGDHYILTDLDSANGTFVNDVRIKKTEIMDRDVVSIGKHRLYFYDVRSAEGAPRASMVESERTLMMDPALPDADAAEPPAMQAEIVITNGRQKGMRFRISRPLTTIGRGSSNIIRLTDWFVSKEHAVIEQVNSQQYRLRDLGSWRRTKLNGIVIQSSLLNHNDVVQLGPSVHFTFMNLSQPPVETRPGVRVPMELDEEALKRIESGEVGAQNSDDERLGEEPGPATALNPFSQAEEEPEADSAEESFRLFRESEDERLFGEEESDAQAVQEEPQAEASMDVEELEALAVRNRLGEAAEQGGSNNGKQAQEEVNELVENIVATSLQAAIASATQGTSAAPAEPTQSWVSFTIPDQAEPALPNMEEREEEESEPDIDLQLFDESQAEAEEPEEGETACSEMAPGGEFKIDGEDTAENESPAAGVEEIEPVPDASVEPEPTEPIGEAAAEAYALKEIQMWERALQNKNLLIRKQAARRLKQLTGKDYEY